MNWLQGPTLEEQVRKWKGELKKQERLLERKVREVDLEEKKLVTEIRKLGTSTQQQNNVKLLAKTIVQARRSKDHLYTSIAHTRSIQLQLQQQMSMLKVTKQIQNSAEVMKMVNRLMKLPEISQAMQQMSLEMEKAGIIGEILDDVLFDETVEEEAEEEVEKLIKEIMAPLNATKVSQDEIAAVEEDNMLQRLNALKN
eukprot:NODE_536_length_7014_cov_0.311208.p4 type:complete len:198 gc:universal NODE_536_length_7014_cov_0.311208:3090-3683(+)